MFRTPSFRLFVPTALVIASMLVYAFNAQPGFTDAFYHYNAAARLVAGDGLTDDYLWTFIGAPDALPAPSHLYWMPGTSLIAAAGMTLLGVRYAAAQVGLMLTLWAAALVAYALGWRIGATPRHAWAAGLLLLCGGFYMRFWGATDTFAPYACFGALALLCMGLAVERLAQSRPSAWWWGTAGLCAACGHLIRSDGLLLVAVGLWVIVYPLPPVRPAALWHRVRLMAAFLMGYGLAMLPWFARNLHVVGVLLPAGGMQAVWYTEYNDLFNYPPGASPQVFFADGLGLLLETRWQAFFNPDGGALWTFIAVEGMVALVPLMLVGAWRRRQQPLLRPTLSFALGIHLAFPLLFPFPGMRGGLFHAVAALMPWWTALAVCGLDDVVNWVARRRRRWRPQHAQRVFTLGSGLLVLALSLSLALPRRVYPHVPALYPALDAALPAGARVMVNDPAQLYYFTGRGGVTFPNAAPDVIQVLAAQYDIAYVLVEVVGDGLLAVPAPMQFDLAAPPEFLREAPVTLPSGRLYRIEPLDTGKP